MGVSVRFGSAIAVLALVGLAACEEAQETTSFQPVGPELSARSTACDFGRMSRDARSYFPGNGRGSISATVQDLIDEMEDACADDEAGVYTAKWFEVAGIIGQVLADGVGGDPADGVSFLNQSVSVLGPGETTPIFDPCEGAENCLPWDGYDAENPANSVLPPFANVLSSPQGAWAVVGQDTDPEAVCSSFTQRPDVYSPCGLGWNSSDPDTWGVEPTTSWGDALWDRTSLLFGYPTSLSSPTRETTFGSGDMSAYDWLLIPYPSEFGSFDSQGESNSSELLVSFCAQALPPMGEYMVQKGSTILTEENFSVWCPLNTQTASAGGESFLHRLAAFLSPLPAPLNAVAAVGKGPGAGGLAGSFTDFYGVNIPTEAVIEIPVQPADGRVNQPVTDRNGNPFRVLTYTSSMQSPLERAEVTIEVVGNSGLIPSGNDVCIEEPDPGFKCDGFVLSGFTQSDEEADPGTLYLPLEFSKTGQYSLCFTADLPPLQFGEPVCTEKFNIRP